jgi:hypothetical protein
MRTKRGITKATRGKSPVRVQASTASGGAVYVKFDGTFLLPGDMDHVVVTREGPYQSIGNGPSTKLLKALIERLFEGSRVNEVAFSARYFFVVDGAPSVRWVLKRVYEAVEQAGCQPTDKRVSMMG